MIIAVDFDGTIVEHQFPEIGKMVHGAYEALTKLRENGHTLVLWTCRNNIDPALNGRKVLDEAIEFLQLQGLKFDAVNKNSISIDFCPVPKIYADIYLDDRNFPKVDPADLWNMVLNSSLC